MRTSSTLLVLLATSAALTASPAVGGSPKTGTSASQNLDRETDAAASAVQAFKKDPDVAPYFGASVGYAVFPNVGKAALIVGGAHGKGKVWERGELIGEAKELTQANVGPQVGGASYSEIIFFKDSDAMARFKRGQVTLAASVSAAALKSGARAKRPGGTAWPSSCETTAA